MGGAITAAVAGDTGGRWRVPGDERIMWQQIAGHRMGFPAGPHWGSARTGPVRSTPFQTPTELASTVSRAPLSGILVQQMLQQHAMASPLRAIRAITGPAVPARVGFRRGLLRRFSLHSASMQEVYTA